MADDMHQPSTSRGGLQAAVLLATSRGVCAIGDLARTSGGTPPLGSDELVDGCLTIAPGTIYLGNVRWWEYTDDPKRLFCRVCGVTILNFWMAINAHVRDNHRPDQV